MKVPNSSEYYSSTPKKRSNNDSNRSLPNLKESLEPESKEVLSSLDGKPQIPKRRIHLSFRDILYTDAGGKIIPRVNGCELTYPPNKPITPVFVKRLKFPLNTEIQKVTPENITRKNISFPAQVKKAPSPLPLTKDQRENPLLSKEDSLTNFKLSTSENPLHYSIRYGIDASTLARRKFLIIRFQPLQYKSTRKGSFIKSVDLQIHSSPEKTKKIKADASNPLSCIILSSKKLSDATNRLASYKNSTGIPSKAYYVENIVEKEEGRDTQQKIKHFLQEKVNNSNIKFLIILGDAGIVPPRYAYIPDGAYDNQPEVDGKLVETDLYYADLFGSPNNTWDDNGDGKWGDLRHDSVDAMPDLLTGRLPASNQSEAQKIVEKVINFEPPKQHSWEVFAGTDTFQTAYPEGEYLSNYMINNFAFNNSSITRLYETTGNLTRGSFIEKINQGPSLVSFAGHGLSRSLMLGMEEYKFSDAIRQYNRKMKPLFVDLSCLATRFADYDCLAEGLLLNPNGGGIGYMGSTRLAWGYIGEMVVEGLAGEMLWRILKSYYSPLRENLGSIWAKAISGYLTENKISTPYSTGQQSVFLNWKTVAEREFLGDPTLSLLPTSFEENKTSSDTLQVNNTMEYPNEYRIHKDGSITISHGGNLTLSNTFLELVNSSISVRNGSITLRNSTIYGNDGLLTLMENGRIKAINSRIIGGTTRLNPGTGRISNSVIDKAQVKYGASSNISLVNSTLDLLVNYSESEEEFTLTNGFYESYNLSTLLQVNISARQSYLGFSIYGKEANLTLQSGTLNELELVQSNLTAVNSTIGTVKLRESSLTVNDSSINVNIVLHGEDNISNLTSEGNFSLDFNGNELYAHNSSITWGFTLVDDANLTLKSVNGSFVTLNSGTITCLNSSLNYITQGDRTSHINVNNSRVMLITSTGTTKIWKSNASAVYSKGNLTVRNSSLSLLSLRKESEINRIMNTTITQFSALGGSTTLKHAEVTYSVVRKNAEITLTMSEFAVLDCYDNTSVLVNASEVFDWLRCFGNTTVNITHSEVWLALSYKDTNGSLLQGKNTGMIKSEIFRRKTGGEIIVSSSYLLGLDVLCYNSTLQISNSEISKLFCFHNSRVLIEDSSLTMLRGTHTTEITASQIKVEEVYLSGTSIADLEQVIIGTLYAMGESQVIIHKGSLNIGVGYGASQVNITQLRGGIIAPFSNSSVSIEDSEIILYASFENTSVNIQGKAPQYVSSWNSSNLQPTPTWDARISNSKLEWTFDLTECQGNITDSQLYSLYLTNSNITMNKVRIQEMFAAFDSKLAINQLKVASYTYFVHASGEIRNSYLSATVYSKSNMTVRNSILIPYLLLTGNATLRLYPGWFSNTTLSDFGDIPDDLQLHLLHTSIIGWGVLSFQGGNVSISDSELMGAGITGASQLSISNSRVAGYLSVFLPDEKMELDVSNSSFSLFLQLYRSRLRINNLEDIENHFSWTTLPGVNIEDSTLMGLDIHATSSKLFIANSVVDNLEGSFSSITISNSYTGSVKSSQSQFFIEETTVGILSAINSEVRIKGSKVSHLEPVYSSLNITNSEIGVRMRLTFASKEITNLNPKKRSGWLNTSKSSLFLKNVEITSYSFVVAGFSSLDLSNSQISYVRIEEWGNTSITSSKVKSVIITGRSQVNVRDSTLSLSLTYKTVQKEIKVSEDSNLNLTEEKKQQNSLGWQLNVKDSNINEINITAQQANLTLSSTHLMDLTALTFSHILVRNSRINRSSILNSQLDGHDSFLRMILPALDANISLEGVECGLSAIFWSQNGTKDLPSTSSLSWVNKRTGVHIQTSACKIFDWSIGVMGFSNLTFVNEHVLSVQTYQFSHVDLIDPVLESPPLAEGLSKISVLRSLEIQVRFDFQKPDTALLKIKRSGEMISKIQAKNGYYSTVLPQAVITGNKRKDLGAYQIKAKVGAFSIEKSLYLHKDKSVTIWVPGPITWGLIGIIAVLVGLAVYQFFIAGEKEKK